MKREFWENIHNQINKINSVAKGVKNVFKGRSLINSTTEGADKQIIYLDSCWGTGQCNQGTSSFIFHSRTGGVEKVINTSDKSSSLRWVGMAHLKEK